MKITLDEALARISNNAPLRSAEAIGPDRLPVKVDVPRGEHAQQPHTRDEVSALMRGRGWFVNGRTHQPIESGDPLFVPAAHSHRFADFSDDFCSCVTRYSSEGGAQS